jgi:diamine N-acetyltransferase
MIVGKRVIIDKLKLSDAYQMMNWKKAEDILMREYHFLTTKDGNVKGWYDARIKRKNMMSFAVKTHEGRVIGFISIREISRIFRSSVLGITFDMDYLNMGYGTESLSLFLDYYFTELNMKKIFLDVAKHNKRAISCYKKVGFELVRQYHARLEEEYYDVTIEQLKSSNESEFMESFWIVGPFILVGYYRMKLSRKVYNTVSTRAC